MHLVSRRRRRDGKGAWCQVRPARRRVHGWATPTRSWPKRCIPAAQLIRSGPRCSCGDGLSASSDAGLHLGDAVLLERCGRMSPAARSTRLRRSAVCLEKLGGCLSSARAGQRPPRGYIAKCRICDGSVPTTCTRVLVSRAGVGVRGARARPAAPGTRYGFRGAARSP